MVSLSLENQAKTRFHLGYNNATPAADLGALQEAMTTIFDQWTHDRIVVMLARCEIAYTNTLLTEGDLNLDEEIGYTGDVIRTQQKKARDSYSKRLRQWLIEGNSLAKTLGVRNYRDPDQAAIGVYRNGGTYIKSVPGAKGDKGDKGNWLNGPFDPSIDHGELTDYWLNTFTSEYFYKTAEGWISLGLLKGADGADGTDGIIGADGQGIDNIELTNEIGTQKTYTIWGDAEKTINLGTFTVSDGADGTLSGAQSIVFNSPINPPTSSNDEWIDFVDFSNSNRRSVREPNNGTVHTYAYLSEILNNSDSITEGSTHLFLTNSERNAIVALQTTEGFQHIEIETPVAGDITLIQSARWEMTIDSIIHQLTSGTITFSLKIETVSVAGISSITATTSEATSTATAANTLNIGDKLILSIISVSSPSKFSADIYFTI